MSIEDKIKRWVVLDNQFKQLQSQIRVLKDEKEELTNHLIEHFDNPNKKYPIFIFSFGGHGSHTSKSFSIIPLIPAR